MKTQILHLRFSAFYSIAFFVCASPGHKGGKEEIKGTEGKPGGPLVHMADLKSLYYS